MTNFRVYYFEVLKKVLKYLKYQKVFQVLGTRSTFPNSVLFNALDYSPFQKVLKSKSTQILAVFKSTSITCISSTWHLKYFLKRCISSTWYLKYFAQLCCYYYYYHFIKINL